jgi:hypothetical protein
LIYNLGTNFHKESADSESQRFVRSGLFQTQDGSNYLLELWAKDGLGRTNAKLVVHAIPTPSEYEQGFMARRVHLRPSVMRYNNASTDKEAQDVFFYSALGQDEESKS